ncbi:MAG: translocation/assembly module TamB [Flavobacteriales bacterium]|nr:translocation/assembly module TamB [Flavobacteriales bacterium]
MIAIALKIIKKALKIFRNLIALILLMLVVFILSLRFSAVQTYLANSVSHFLFDEYNVEVSFQKIQVHSFDRIGIQGLYVEDLRKDTLLYMGILDLDLVWPDFDNMVFTVDELKLYHTKFYLKQFKGDSVLNLQFIIDKFASEDTSQSETPDFTILAHKIGLTDVSFKWQDENDTSVVRSVNFSDLDIQKFDLQASEFYFHKGEIRASVDKLALNEKSGFQLDSLAGKFHMTDAKMLLDSFIIVTPHSNIGGDYSLAHNNYEGFSNFIDSVEMVSHLELSSINMKDIAFFSGPLIGMHQELNLRGEFKGTVSQFEFNKMAISLSDKTQLFGSLKMKGLPDIDKTLIELELTNSRVDVHDARKIQLPPFDTPNYLELPADLLALGTVKLNGHFTGTYRNFKANSVFSTSIGRGKTDLDFSFIKDTAHYDGLLKLNDFAIGKLIGQNNIGPLDMDVEVIGKGLSLAEIQSEVLGYVSRFGYNGYEYRGITVDAFIEKEKFEGFVNVKDKNADLSFNGSLDFSQKKPKLEFRLNVDSLFPARTNLVARDSSFFISGKISSDIVGLSIEDIVGDVSLDSLVIIEGDKKFETESIVLHSYFANDIRRLEFSSPIGSGLLRGNYKPGDVVSTIKHMMHGAMPSFFTMANPDTTEQTYSAFIELNDLNPLLEIFYPSLKQPYPVFIRSSFSSKEKEFTLSVTGKGVQWNSIEINEFLIDLNMKDSSVVQIVDFYQLAVNDEVIVQDVKTNISLGNDSMRTVFSMERNGVHKNHIYLDIRGGVLPGQEIFVRIDSSDVMVADSIWLIGKSNGIVIDTNKVTVKNLDIFSSGKYIKVNGVYSEIPGDELYVQIKGLNLANLSKISGDNGMKLNGEIGGVIAINSLATNPYIMSDIELKDIAINEKVLGTGVIESFWNHQSSRFEVDVDLTRYPDLLVKDTVKSLKLMGYYYPNGGDTAFDFFFSTEGLYLHMIEPIVSRFMDNIDGKIYGSLELQGGINSPVLVGELEFDSVQFRVDYLNTSYLIHNETLIFKEDWFGFNRLRLVDENGQGANVVGTIYHDKWRDMNFDVAINAKKFMALNTTSKDNELFYGNMFLTGDINVSGYADNVFLEIYAKTDNNSVINIPVVGGEDVGESDFITFVSPSWLNVEEIVEKKVDLTGINLLFDMEIDPTTKARIIFDEATGDIIETKGTGKIKMEIDQAANFTMFGDYEIVSGIYNFSYKNIFAKKFKLESGGKITWTGDPLDAFLDLTAIYDVKASIGPLLGDTTQTKKVDNECLLNISSKLSSPDFKFDIRLKNVGNDVEAQVKSQMPTQDEVNKQFFSLLLFNKYSPPESNFGGTGGGAWSSEMIANQLNMMLSKLDNDVVDIGFSQVTKDNVEVAVSKNLLNDRLIFESNVGVDNSANTQANNNNQSQFVGDFKLEYLIRADGRLRAKVFNRTESVSLESQNSGTQTQGVGVFFRHDFESYPALIRSIFQRKSKK